ncbi:MAG: zinc ribbon domain-containing protein [Acidobacteria bacterium]|nr:zinc ribbon domain-containing protein [Acidobacteriota bacterium]
MPLYEYRCRKCEHEFETLVLPTFPDPECPSCKSQDLEKLISGFAVSSDTIRQANAKSSIREQKSKYKDQAIAEEEYRHKELHDQ